VTRNPQFSFAAVKGFWQINANRGLQRFTASRARTTTSPGPAATTTASAELKSKSFKQIAEGAEDIVDVVKATAATGTFDARMPHAIVASPLVGIVQHFKGF
jgi:hypothetical protein